VSVRGLAVTGRCVLIVVEMEAFLGVACTELVMMTSL
jgi:hypothetical protein